MKLIKKGREPKSLREYRTAAYATYEGYPNKDELRDLLAREQGHICCYCMSRIRPTADGMKIEHWASQDLHPDLQLAHSNLFGACKGGEGRPGDEQHCDTSKGNREITISPTDSNRNCERLLHYLGDGTVESDDPIIQRDISGILRLNTAPLPRNREAVLRGALKSLAGKYKGEWTVALLKHEIDKWRNLDAEGMYAPYCQVVVQYLEKKLRQRQGA
jgi:uncharacterized protein (TIGR02646 family)